MEITTKYTLEDWRTQKMEVHDIPDEVLSLSLEDILKKSFLDIRSLDLNPIELVFSCIFLYNDWRVVRMPMSRNGSVSQYVAVAIEEMTGVRDALYGPGVPDFFLWNSAGQHRFVEIKASEDSLNDNQQEWAETYDWNFVIAQLAHISDDNSRELSDKE